MIDRGWGALDMEGGRSCCACGVDLGRSAIYPGDPPVTDYVGGARLDVWAMKDAMHAALWRCGDCWKANASAGAYRPTARIYYFKGEAAE